MELGGRSLTASGRAKLRPPGVNLAVPSLAHARTVIETWRREYNEERPKESLGGLTPAEHATTLAVRAITMPEDSKANRY